MVNPVCLAGCGLIFLTGCATPVLKVAEIASDFELEARFALQFEQEDGGAQQVSGSLHWVHGVARDHLTLFSPFGNALGEILRMPGYAEVRMADGRLHQGEDAESLLLTLTGYPLPLSRLPVWLNPRLAGLVRSVDEQGRVVQIEDQDWRIDYFYPDDLAVLPERLVIRRGQATTLKLKITRWETPA